MCLWSYIENQKEINLYVAKYRHVYQVQLGVCMQSRLSWDYYIWMNLVAVYGDKKYAREHYHYRQRPNPNLRLFHRMQLIEYLNLYTQRTIRELYRKRLY
jgi:hypothetical protein